MKRPTHWPSRRWIVRAIAFFLVALFVMTLLVRSVGLDVMLEAIQQASVPLALLALGFYMAELALRVLRWLLLLRHPRQGEGAAIWWIGTGINEVTPTGTGELARLFVAAKAFGIHTSRVLAPTAVERLTDLVILLAAAATALALMVLPVGRLPLIFGAAIVGLGFLVLFRPMVLNPLVRVLCRRTGRIHRVGHALGELVGELHRTGHRLPLLALVGLAALAIWTCEAAVQFFMLQALNVQVEFAVVFGLTALAFLAGFFSFLPGGLGARETSLALLLSTQGAAFDHAATAAVSVRAVQTLLVLVGAVAATMFILRRAGSKADPTGAEAAQ